LQQALVIHREVGNQAGVANTCQELFKLGLPC
jgi:hypothetical protein